MELTKFLFSLSTVKLVSVNVIGDGIVADMYRDLVDIFESLLQFYDVDFDVCLPRPYRPIFSQYLKIVFLVATCWLLVILEPYGMRLRHLIMDYHYPERTLERSVWLYYRILRKRTSFVEFARRQATKRVFKKRPPRDESMTCQELLRSKLDR